jgi:hypothetical protein
VIDLLFLLGIFQICSPLHLITQLGFDDILLLEFFLHQRSVLAHGGLGGEPGADWQLRDHFLVVS